MLLPETNFTSELNEISTNSGDHVAAMIFIVHGDELGSSICASSTSILRVSWTMGNGNVL